MAALLTALAGAVVGEDHDAQPPADAPVAVAQGLRAILDERLPGANEQLADALAAKLARRPAHGRTAAMFDAAMSSPFGFETPLAEFADRTLAATPQSPLALLRGLLREWRLQFGEPSAGAARKRAVREGEPLAREDPGACNPSPLPPPADLDQAATQIKELAAITVALQRDAMSKRTRRSLASQHAAIAERLRDTGTGAMSRRERRRLRRFAAKLEAANAASAICAAATWARLADPAWLDALRRLLAAHPRAGGTVIRHENTPWGEVVLAGAADGVWHSRTVLFFADLGGNDFHGIDGTVDFLGHPQFVVDFAGDDRYESTSPGGFGAGVGRTAIVIDLAGDDRYRSGGQGHGYALFGVGAVLDRQGDDRYHAHHHAQGAAWHGVGLIVDGGGNDQYRVAALGQGVGLPQGVGVLWDVRGDDSYAALGGAPTNYGTPGLADAWAQGVARGLRGIAPGGVGLLVDSAGNDAYDAGSFAQGGGYYRGVGQLLDHGNGRDVLFGSRYNAGWGAHGGVGRFYNEAGDDRYATRNIVAAGLAWDYSLALFHDRAGNDAYHLPGFSFGSAAHQSVGIFVDGAGRDDYRDAKPAQAEPGDPNVAVFFDADSGQDAGGGAWQDSPPSCSRPSERALVLLGTGGDPPRCSDGEAETSGP